MGSTKKYDKEYKEQAVKLAHDLGSPKEAAEQLGIPRDTLYGWIKKWRDGYLDIGPEARSPENVQHLNEEVEQLLDEYEKCCPAVKRLFMSIFEYGKLQLANNKVLVFAQTIIIATTNAGGSAVRVSYIGFNSDETESVPTVKELSGSFDIEILNRFSRILHFHPISEQVYRDIIRDKYKREAAEIKHRVGKKGDSLPDTLPYDVLNDLVNSSYNSAFGARPALGVVRDYIENILID